METKICTKCGRELPISEFYKKGGKKDGLRSSCKECDDDYSGRYKEEHKEDIRKYKRNYAKTPMGRASYLLSAYNHKDIAANRGKGDLTSEWIVKNIFSKPCVHCGKIGWDLIGCNRIDNSLPHTMNNVEPCCKECNDKLAAEEWKITRGCPVDQIDTETGEVVASFPSANAAASVVKSSHNLIIKACNGGYFDKSRGKWHTIGTIKGFVWRCYSNSI